MPCSVCGVRFAVFECHSGRFSPCWSCQDEGWSLSRKRKRWSRRGAAFFNDWSEILAVLAMPILVIFFVLAIAYVYGVL